MSNVIERAMNAAGRLDDGDCDEVEQSKHAQAIRDLLAIIERLPVTADGVPVVPGETVWRWRRVVGIGGQVVGWDMVVEECEVWEHCRYCECDRDIASAWGDEVSRCYSTRAAAKEARKANGSTPRCGR